MVSIDTADPAELGEALAIWDPEYVQLGHGRFAGHVSVAQTARMQFVWKRWSTGMLVRTATPPGISLLGGPVTSEPASRVRGLPIGPNELGFIRPGVETDYRSPEPSSLFLVAVEEELLESHAMALLGQPLTSLARGSRLRLRVGVDELHRRIAPLDLEEKCRRPELLADPVVAAWLEDRLLDGMVSAIAPNERASAPRGSVRLARQVDDYLRGNLQAPLTISGLCTAMGAPERTLHQAVRTHLGLSPKALLKTLRLNAVRQALLTAPPGIGVMNIAMEWGFFHAGWFSQDYRLQFGESPSTTLRNGVRP